MNASATDILRGLIRQSVGQSDAQGVAQHAVSTGASPEPDKLPVPAKTPSDGADTSAKACENVIPVELSARHVHLSEADALALFGSSLTPVRELSQPGQFLCKERVRLIGPKAVIDNVAVLGPSRGRSQVEISKTDARALGLDAPVRHSGDIAGTPGIILASFSQNLGQALGLEEGVIVAARHIHMSPEEARRLCVADGETVSVRLDGERPLVLEGVKVRVNDQFRLALHIDSDEGNGSGWSSARFASITRRDAAQNALWQRM